MEQHPQFSQSRPQVELPGRVIQRVEKLRAILPGSAKEYLQGRETERRIRPAEGEATQQVLVDRLIAGSSMTRSSGKGMIGGGRQIYSERRLPRLVA